MNFILFQGEIVDLYLKEYKLLIVVISSSMHVASMISSISAEILYTKGGWLLCGSVMAAFNLLPLAILPLFSRIQTTNHTAQGHEMNSISCPRTNLATPGHEMNFSSCQRKKSLQNNNEIVKQSANKMTKLQLAAFYMPDLVTFVNNTIFNLLAYSLPERMVKFTVISLDKAVPLANLINVFSLISALALGVLAEKKTNCIIIIAVGNVVFYSGSFLTFCSTTKFLDFPFQFEIGSVLIGIGDAAVVNLCIMSKFFLYERWGLDNRCLGKKATLLFNGMLNLSAVVGISIAGLTLTKGSEVPCFIGLLLLSVFTTTALTFTVVINFRGAVVPGESSPLIS